MEVLYQIVSWYISCGQVFSSVLKSATCKDLALCFQLIASYALTFPEVCHNKERNWHSYFIYFNRHERVTQ
jgi:hypothetical protein